MSILNRILEELSPGDILQGRYTIVRKVGGGGMGIVYEANDGRMAGRQVAIKEMRQANFSSEQLAKIKKQFEREANILNLLHHPNLPRVYDSFEENGRYYLVMEFIEGETLEKKQAEAERKRADVLAEKLRSLGVDPDQL